MAATPLLLRLAALCQVTVLLAGEQGPAPSFQGTSVGQGTSGGDVTPGFLQSELGLGTALNSHFPPPQPALRPRGSNPSGTWGMSRSAACISRTVQVSAQPGDKPMTRGPIGQQHGMTKCNTICDSLTSKAIPPHLLVSYQHRQDSCGKPTVILNTKRGRTFCADPKDKWVQEAMAHLDRKAAASTAQNGGKFEKRIGEEVSQPVLTQSEATGESSSWEPPTSQEARRPMGTSPEPQVRMTGSSGTSWLPTSKAQDGGPPAAPKGSELVNSAAISTTVAWQRSAGSSPQAERKSSNVPSTKPPSTEPPSTEPPSTEPPSTEPPITEPPSTHAPSTLYLTTEGQALWIQGQSPSSESSVGPWEKGPNPAQMGAFQDWGPSSTSRASVVPISSEGTPSQEPMASSSSAPKTEEPIHATVDPQRRVLITPVPDSQAATRRQAVGLLAFLGLLFCLGVAMFAYQSLQGCPRKMAGEMVEGLRYVPRSCGSNSYVLVPV
ncbi:fractalkine [Ctenodactylus gundi]